MRSWSVSPIELCHRADRQSPTTFAQSDQRRARYPLHGGPVGLVEAFQLTARQCSVKVITTLDSVCTMAASAWIVTLSVACPIIS